MKNLLKISVLAAVVVASATFASADTIQLGSYATSGSAMGNANTAMNYAGFQPTSMTPSTGTASSYFLDPSGVWSAAIANSTWVGFATNAGPNGTSNPDFGFYTFTTNFTASMSGVPYTGSISVLADDTTEVLLNGSILIPFGTLGSDSHCADVAPTCLTTTSFYIAPTMLLGGVNANTLTFVVEQQGVGPKGGTGDPSGLDFNATLTAVPEPSSLLMLGTGLFGSAGMLYRRVRS